MIRRFWRFSLLIALAGQSWFFLTLTGFFYLHSAVLFSCMGYMEDTYRA